MPYLIDGNNLAGKLHILKDAGFDLTLTDMVKEFCQQKNKKAVLVFDSNDPLGDRFVDDIITVIYTPRDVIYANADDKIIELMQNEKKPQDWVVVSDDNDIIDAAQKLDIDVVLASEFARKLQPNIETNDDDELSSDNVECINDEFMEEWG